jgi:MoaD family protein
MPVTVLIPAPLRPYTNNQETVELEGTTVGELLEALVVRFANLKKHLYAEDGHLRSYVNIYVNDEDIRSLQHEQTPVTEKDVISIIPSIAGGKEGMV